MLIGELVRISGMSRDTIRYYEKRGLLKSGSRRDNNYKDYPPESPRILKSVARLKHHGFTLKEIEEFVNLFTNQRKNCSSTAPLLEKKLADLERRLAELKQIKKDLSAALKKCEQHPDGRACQVLDFMFQV